ncbi:hypothetical protein ACFWD7_40050 [Streptomyces mirabilis]|uniref:hypothetical protein n=1 Tax=Streptomyces mirabilis TaxID=68239 RepID=UPI0021BEACB6|nr:hypothetical protein [Streptomyces mirabilis]MCT9112323.1 hypothetical protein [Streptomyces mirabilis]
MRQRRRPLPHRSCEPPEGEVFSVRNRDSAWAARCAREAAARLDRTFEGAFGGTPSEATVVRRVVRARPDRALVGPWSTARRRRAPAARP